jgi:hypothetical protein
VAENEDCVGALGAEEGALGLDHLDIFEELVSGEESLSEGASSGGRLDSRQPDESHLESVRQLHQMRVALQRQELLPTRLRTQVSGDVDRAVWTAVPIRQEEGWAEVELVVADSRRVQLQRIVEVVHDLARTDEGRCLYSSLELVASVNPQNIAGIFQPYGLYHLGHELESPVGIALVGVATHHLGGKGSAVYVIGANYSDLLKASLGPAAHHQSRQHPSQTHPHSHLIYHF